MTAPDELHVVTRPQTDQRLGRQVVHDPESRRFAVPRAVDLPVASFRHSVFDPYPTPYQQVGCCTGCDMAVRCDTAGNRVRGVVLGMRHALQVYTRATQLDPWPGSYPMEDTGSSGLAACKAAREQGLIISYQWIIQGGVDQVLTELRSKPVGVGTWFTTDMFEPDPETLLVEPTGQLAGGHQWSLVGWSKRYQAFEGRCWWGDDFGDGGLFRIRKTHMADLLADDGDANIVHRAGQNA